MPALNMLVANIETPPIPAAHAWAARYDGANGPALDLCQAVPGWEPHPNLLTRLASASADPAHARYGLINGDLSLRETYAADLSRTYAGQIRPDQVAITSGCNQAFVLAMLTLARPGDNVLLPLPWFWNHQQTTTMLGLEPRPLPCSPADAFVPDPARAETLIDARTAAIVLITPNNPTGAVYPPGIIAAFRDLARKHDVWLILDETYRDFLPTGQARGHDLFADPAWPENVIQLYSFSKAYSVPGARVGAITAAAPLIANFMKALDCLHICPQRPAQTALEWAIRALPEWRAENRGRINDRADAMARAFASIPQWRIDSLGAYFAYVRHPFLDQASPAIVETMASRYGAVCLPGTAFGPGQERYIRLAFANTSASDMHDLAARLHALAACEAAGPALDIALS